MNLTPLIPALALACVGAGCGGASPRPREAGTSGSPTALAPTIDELKNTTYTGVDDRLGPLTLVNGRWTGTPPAPGGASRPVVELAEGFRIVGDLDGDGLDEAVAALAYTQGGTASVVFLAVATRRAGVVQNVATTVLGDRVQVRSARIDGGRLHVRGIQGGPGDPSCCPGELVDWQWGLGRGRLNSLGTVTTGRLSSSMLGETLWVLRAWDITEPAGSDPVITLGYDSGRFVGRSGCNRFVAGVQDGAMPGDVTVGAVGGTRMACPDAQASVETRFLDQLGGAARIGFRMGQLAISYTRSNGSSGTMLFEASTLPKEP